METITITCSVLDYEQWKPLKRFIESIDPEGWSFSRTADVVKSMTGFSAAAVMRRLRGLTPEFAYSVKAVDADGNVVDAFSWGMVTSLQVIEGSI